MPRSRQMPGSPRGEGGGREGTGEEVATLSWGRQGGQRGYQEGQGGGEREGIKLELHSLSIEPLLRWQD